MHSTRLNWIAICVSVGADTIWRPYVNIKVVALETITKILGRTGQKKYGYELLALKPMDEPPKDLATPTPPSNPTAARPKPRSQRGNA
jgi:hypothetical protein